MLVIRGLPPRLHYVVPLSLSHPSELELELPCESLPLYGMLTGRAHLTSATGTTVMLRDAA